MSMKVWWTSILFTLRVDYGFAMLKLKDWIYDWDASGENPAFACCWKVSP